MDCIFSFRYSGYHNSPFLDPFSSLPPLLPSRLPAVDLNILSYCNMARLELCHGCCNWFIKVNLKSKPPFYVRFNHL